MSDPTILRRENGGWLAVSGKDAPFRIGVEAWSAGEARNRFSRAEREWTAIRDGRCPTCGSPTITEKQ